METYDHPLRQTTWELDVQRDGIGAVTGGKGERRKGGGSKERGVGIGRMSDDGWRWLAGLDLPSPVDIQAALCV